MKIDYKRNCSGGAYWEIKYDNGTTASVMGIKNMKQIINNAKEPTESMESLGFQEHSELIKIIKSKNEKQKKR